MRVNNIRIHLCGGDDSSKRQGAAEFFVWTKVAVKEKAEQDRREDFMHDMKDRLKRVFRMLQNYLKLV